MHIQAKCAELERMNKKLQEHHTLAGRRSFDSKRSYRVSKPRYAINPTNAQCLPV